MAAGIDRGDAVDRVVVQAMPKIGYGLRGRHPKAMTAEMVESADCVITVGRGVDASTCPAAFVPTEGWSLDDPKGQPMEKVREMRGEIRRRVENLVQEVSA